MYSLIIKMFFVEVILLTLILFMKIDRSAAEILKMVCCIDILKYLNVFEWRKRF